MELDFTAIKTIKQEAAKRDFTPAKGAHSLEKQKRERERYTAACTEYQENIKRSEELRAEILKGIRSGEDLEKLLINSLKCISLMTGDTVIYNQGVDALRTRTEGLNRPIQEPVTHPGGQ